MEKMLATVFHGVNDIRVEEVDRPRAGVGEAVIRMSALQTRGSGGSIIAAGTIDVGVIHGPAQQRPR